ncbi:Dihydrolipoyllysine-residue acetyltransferase component of pyruvate dehydrogenase complex [subsurface metagenome]
MAKYIIMPKLGFNMDQGTVVHWLKKEGDAIEEREEVLEIETDKTVMPVEAPCSGVLRKILVAEGEEVLVTLPIAIIGEKDEDISDMVKAAYQRLGKKEVIEAPKEVTPVIEKKPTLEPRKEAEKRISPRARRKAKELGIQIERLTGSGPANATSEKDVLAYHETHQEKISTEDQADKRIPYTGMRKIIGDRLSQSKFTAPHIYFTVSIDMSKVIDLLNRFNQDSEERISINDFLASTVAKVLTEQPNINCSLVGEEIVYHKDINIGVAVALEEGLIVPVIKNANKKSLSILSKEIKKLIKLAREKKLIPDNYKEGTFTVSNLGMYGIDNFTAIMNPPEAAILAVGAVKRAPIVIEEEGVEKLGIRSLMKVTLSVDHRLIDGATAATFLKQVKDYLEFPEGLVL